MCTHVHEHMHAPHTLRKEERKGGFFQGWRCGADLQGLPSMQKGRVYFQALE